MHLSYPSVEATDGDQLNKVIDFQNNFSVTHFDLFYERKDYTIT